MARNGNCLLILLKGHWTTQVPLYTMVRAYDHMEILRALKTHPKVVPLKFDNHLGVSRGSQV
jgi:hypothetical protein